MREIAASDIPHTIQRATRFHELLPFVLRRAERLPVAPLPMRWRFQSVTADEVAARLVELAEERPLGPRRVIDLRLPDRVSRRVRGGLNTCPQHAGGRLTWPEFVSRQASG